MIKLILISIIIIAVVSLTGCSNKKEKSDIEKKCGSILWEGSYADDCCMACDKFGYEYLSATYNSGGIGRQGVNKCFCKNGNDSKQIY